MTTSWYLKKSDGAEYGPVELSELQNWAKDGRVAPEDQLSVDRKEWMRAPELVALQMHCLIRFRNGAEYGPLHARALCDLVLQSDVAFDEPVFDRARNDTLPAGLAALRALTLDPVLAVADPSEEAASLRAECDRAKAALAKAQQAVKEQATERPERDAELDTLRAERDAALAALAEAEAKASGVTDGLEEQKREAEARLAELTTAQEAAVEEANDRIASLESELSSVRASLDEHRSSGESTAREVAERDAEWNALRTEREAAWAAKAEAEANVAEITARREAEKQEAEARLAELTAAQEVAAAEANDRLASLESELSSVRASLEEHRSSGEATAREVAERDAEWNALRTEREAAWAEAEARLAEMNTSFDKSRKEWEVKIAGLTAQVAEQEAAVQTARAEQERLTTERDQARLQAEEVDTAVQKAVAGKTAALEAQRTEERERNQKREANLQNRIQQVDQELKGRLAERVREKQEADAGPSGGAAPMKVSGEVHPVVRAALSRVRASVLDTTGHTHSPQSQAQRASLLRKARHQPPARPRKRRRIK